MLLPYPSDHRPERPPVLTWTLLLITIGIALFLVVSEHIRTGSSIHFLEIYGLIPGNFHPLSLLTYTFLHADIGHLLVNVFYLWVFGAGIEGAIGRVKYLLLYVGGGAVGGALQALAALRAPDLLNPNVPIVGASAACACLVGLYAVRYYRETINFVGIPYRPNVVEVITLFLAFETGVGIWSLFIGMSGDGVAHWAHIGGFVFGLCCAYLLKLDRSGQSDYWNKDALQAMGSSHPGVAIHKWEKLLAREPENAGARAELARSWLLFGDQEQAALQFIDAIRTYLRQERRKEAARLFVEMRDSLLESLRTTGRLRVPRTTGTSVLSPELACSELFILGNAMEENRDYAPSAEALRAVSVRNPDSPEAETALLKVIALYIHRLDRCEEARILLRLFLERYPHSALRAQAEELRRAAERQTESRERNQATPQRKKIDAK